ncbi:MAG: hypothetical protein OXF93_19495 [Acidobacteria bacterium]|nr:hypothetical protein [Acidobacteriota bacterium]
MAAREFAEIWGEQMHAARQLRVVTGALALVVTAMRRTLVTIPYVVAEGLAAPRVGALRRCSSRARATSAPARRAARCTRRRRARW